MNSKESQPRAKTYSQDECFTHPSTKLRKPGTEFTPTALYPTQTPNSPVCFPQGVRLKNQTLQLFFKQIKILSKLISCIISRHFRKTDTAAFKNQF